MGDGTSTSNYEPQPIQTNDTWIAVAAGGGCGHLNAGDGVNSVAIRSDGTLWVWGYGADGERTSRPKPVLTNMTWKAISASPYHILAVRTDGTLWAWGDDHDGQLGDGYFEVRSDQPKLIGTNTNWQVVAAGDYHSVALRTDGTLWSWGLNNYGQLGNGDQLRTNQPQPIMPNMTWKAIAAGREHTLVLRDDGQVWGSGSSFENQLGDAVPSNFCCFLDLHPIFTNGVWQAIAAGRFFSLALREDGTLWAQGQNDGGQLGDGTYTKYTKPVQVLGGNVWSAAP